jgi:glyoxylase-like metal-dependent hydrolase (beta-lactamase superfamily II)
LYGAEEPFLIDEWISVIGTPGHTSEDVSVLVKTKEQTLVVVAGDLFECEEDIDQPDLWTSNSHDPALQSKNRLSVLRMAQEIVPGHGAKFTVTEEHRLKAQILADKYNN